MSNEQHQEQSKKCLLPECGKPHIAKGYCQNHYRVFKRHGTPTPVKPELKTHTATGGYKFITDNGRTKYLHVAAAEKAIGKELPVGAEVHHINGNPSDNANGNLVVCPNHEYHMLIHQRERSLNACGNPNHRPCRICGEYDSVDNMAPYRKQFYHRACCADQSRNQRARAKNSTKEKS